MEKDISEALAKLVDRQTALETMFVGLALAVADEDRERLARIVTSIDFMRVYSSLTYSKDVLPYFDVVLARLRAAQSSPGSTRSSFAVELFLTAATPTHLRDALQTWLGTMATEEEVCEEIRDALKRLSDEPAGPQRDASRKGGNLPAQRKNRGEPDSVRRPVPCKKKKS